MNHIEQEIDITPITFCEKPFEQLPYLTGHLKEAHKNPLTETMNIYSHNSTHNRMLSEESKLRSASIDIKQNLNSKYDRFGKSKREEQNYQEILNAKDSQIQKLREEVAYLRSQNTPQRYRQRAQSFHPLERENFHKLHHRY